MLRRILVAILACTAILGVGLARAQATPAPATPDTTTLRPDSTAAAPAVPAPAAAAPAVKTPAPASTPPPPPPAPAAASKSAGPSPIYYGGTMSFSFGSTTSIGVFPMVGYKLTPRISGGVEAGYEYVSYDSGQSTDNYGGSIFGRLRVGRNLYAHAEYESFNYEIFSSQNKSSREWVPALLLGGGFVKPISARTSVYAEVLFDVLQDDNSPYSDWEPRVSFGVAVGF